MLHIEVIPPFQYFPFFHIQYTAQILLTKINLKLLLKSLHTYFAEDNSKVLRYLNDMQEKPNNIYILK